MGRGLPHFNARTAVVTGAASGIGRALALQLARQGCNLAIVDQQQSGLQRLQTELSQSNPRVKVTTHVADVSNREQMRLLPAEVIASHGAVQLLINNAGIGYEAAFQQTPLDAWERVMAVNLWGAIHGCHFFLPYLAKQERAHIVNLSSLFGYIGMPGQTAYCASKFAVRGFSEALQEELRTTSIGLTLVHPGAVATNIMKSSAGDDPELLSRISRWYEKHAIAPEKAARLILAAVHRGQPRLLITWGAVFADYLKRLLPVAGNRFICNAVISTLGLEDMRDKRSKQWRQTMQDRDR